MCEIETQYIVVLALKLSGYFFVENQNIAKKRGATPSLSGVYRQKSCDVTVKWSKVAI